MLYAGNMGLKQGLSTVLEAAARMRHRTDILFFLVGDGMDKARLVAQHRALGLANVRFLPLQAEADLPEMLAAADVCVVPQLRSVTDSVMPSKLATILASGRPVIAGAHPGSQVDLILREGGCGVVVEPEDPVALADAIVQLHAHPDRRAALGTSGHAYAREHFPRTGILHAYETRLCAMVSTNGS